MNDQTTLTSFDVHSRASYFNTVDNSFAVGDWDLRSNEGANRSCKFVIHACLMLRASLQKPTQSILRTPDFAGAPIVPG